MPVMESMGWMGLLVQLLDQADCSLVSPPEVFPHSTVAQSNSFGLKGGMQRSSGGLPQPACTFPTWSPEKHCCRRWETHSSWI